MFVCSVGVTRFTTCCFRAVASPCSDSRRSWRWTRSDHQPCGDRNRKSPRDFFSFLTSVPECCFASVLSGVKGLVFGGNVCRVTVNTLIYLSINMTPIQMLYCTSATFCDCVEIHPLYLEIQAFWRDVVILLHMWVKPSLGYLKISSSCFYLTYILMNIVHFFEANNTFHTQLDATCVVCSKL